MTQVKLELLTDIDMVVLFEKGIRGGISKAVKRYGSANNKQIPNYIWKQLSSYLMYVDGNNVQGWAMSKKLPIDGFNWYDNLKMFTFEFIENYDEDSDTGHLVEVDIEYPKILHEAHRHFHFYQLKKRNYLLLLKTNKSMF